MHGVAARPHRELPPQRRLARARGAVVVQLQALKAEGRWDVLRPQAELRADERRAAGERDADGPRRSPEGPSAAGESEGEGRHVLGGDIGGGQSATRCGPKVQHEPFDPHDALGKRHADARCVDALPHVRRAGENGAREG